MNIPQEVFETAFNKLKIIIKEHTPFCIVECEGEIDLATRSEYSDYIFLFKKIKRKRSKLSEEASVTLMIIAYNQPVGKSAIDKIRNTDSEKTLDTLKKYGLIAYAGRTDDPGKPILYVTTREFLRIAGLNSLSDLPPLNIDYPINK